MSRVAASPVVTMLACFFHLAREAMGAGYRTRTFPAPSLCKARRLQAKPRARKRAAGLRTCVCFSDIRIGRRGERTRCHCERKRSNPESSPRSGLLRRCAPRNDGAGLSVCPNDRLGLWVPACAGTMGADVAPAARASTIVIPGRCAASNPESRDSGSGACAPSRNDRGNHTCCPPLM